MPFFPFFLDRTNKNIRIKRPDSSILNAPRIMRFWKRFWRIEVISPRNCRFAESGRNHAFVSMFSDLKWDFRVKNGILESKMAFDPMAEQNERYVGGDWINSIFFAKFQEFVYKVGTMTIKE